MTPATSDPNAATSDPTAGATARAISIHPEVPRPVDDPTDPRYGRLPSDPARPGGEAPRISDPTNPDCGQPAA